MSIWARVRKHHLFSFAATGAYFLLMSFIPFILVLLVLIRYTTLSETDMMNVLISVVPSQLEKFVSLIVREVYTKSAAVVPISVVITLWSAAKAFHALTYGLDVIYDVEETRNWFYVRFRSMIYTLSIALVLMAMLFLMVFGKGVRALQSADLSVGLRFILTNRYSLSCVLMTAAFIFMYKVLPDRKLETIDQVPGALIAGIGWTGFSWFLSIFYNPTIMNTYGSLTAIILAMIWMYFCMYFFLIGAELNAILMEQPENNLVLIMIRDVSFAFFTMRERKEAEEERERGLRGEISVFPEHKKKTDWMKRIRKRKAAI